MVETNYQPLEQSSPDSVGYPVDPAILNARPSSSESENEPIELANLNRNDPNVRAMQDESPEGNPIVNMVDFNDPSDRPDDRITEPNADDVADGIVFAELSPWQIFYRIVFGFACCLPSLILPVILIVEMWELKKLEPDGLRLPVQDHKLYFVPESRFGSHISRHDPEERNGTITRHHHSPQDVAMFCYIAKLEFAMLWGSTVAILAPIALVTFAVTKCKLVKMISKSNKVKDIRPSARFTPMESVPAPITLRRQRLNSDSAIMVNPLFFRRYTFDSVDSHELQSNAYRPLAEIPARSTRNTINSSTTTTGEYNSHPNRRLHLPITRQNTYEDTSEEAAQPSTSRHQWAAGRQDTLESSDTSSLPGVHYGRLERRDTISDESDWERNPQTIEVDAQVHHHG